MPAYLLPLLLAFVQSGQELVHLDELDPYLLKHGQRATIHSPVAPYGDSPSVEVSVIIDEHGTVASVHSLSGPNEVFSEAEAAEKQLRFEPILRGGRPVRATFTDIVAVLPPERWRTPHVPFPLVHHPNTIVFRMERRLGSISGPVLSAVQVNPDRIVQFTRPIAGSRYPRQFESRISAESYAKLLHEFRDSGFYSMYQEYEAPITDAHGIRLSIMVDGQTRTVATYAGQLVGAPDAFYRLVTSFDELAARAKWAEH